MDDKRLTYLRLVHPCRHQSIKALVVLHNQIAQIVAVVFLNNADLGVRHPLAVSLVQACIIGVYQCPVSISLHMYMACLLGSFFMTLNAYLETPPELAEGRLFCAGATMLGCLLFSCLLPLQRSAALERTAREMFLKENMRRARRAVQD
jgi:hypothetical protein